VEALRRLVRAEHCHVERKVRIERCCETPCGQASAIVEVGHLTLGVSSGVGAPRGIERGLLTGHCVDGSPQLRLDGSAGCLDLPAGEVCTVILEEEPDVSWATAGGHQSVAGRAASIGRALEEAHFRR